MKKLFRRSLIVVLLITIFSLGRGIWSSAEYLDDVQRNKDEINALREENQRLQEEKEFRQSDFYIEKAARDSLGLARDGETILVEEEAATASAQEEKLAQQSNWRNWFDLFFATE